MSFRSRLHSLFARRKMDADMSEEMRLHLEQRERENLAAGMSPDDAHYAALRKFGGVEQFKEIARDQRRFAWLEQCRMDLRFAVRSLRKNPGFTVVALLTLALGIGVNSSAFSVLNALLLHPLAYPQPDRLVRVFQTQPDSPRPSFLHAPANFLDQRQQNGVFERMAAWQPTTFNLGEPGQPADRVPGLAVTADFLPLLGIGPELGRVFTPDEDRPGGNAVIVLSHGAWLQRFGGDAGIVGRTVRVNGEPVTIIGVMPAAVDDFLLWGDVALWRPLALSEPTRLDRNNNTLHVAGRLKSGISLAAAQTAMDTLAGRLARDYPQFNAQSGLRLIPLGRSAQDDIGRGVTWMVMGLAAFVLLIACANLANLQFARNAARGREHAVRAALGASRAQLLRHVLTESLLLSVLGGLLALGVAIWTNDVLGRFFIWGDHVGLELPLDGRVLGFTFAVSLLTGLAFGVAPAWLAAGANVGETLKPGARGSTSGPAQQRVRHALIVAEVALALVLLSGAGFFLRGLQRFATREPGWRTDGLLTAYVSLKGQTYATTAAREAFFRHLQERVAALPGVEQVAVGSSLPTWGFGNNNSFVVEGRPEPAPNRAPSAAAADILPGYFATLGIRILSGRDFNAGDREDTPAVVIINESMARRYWPGENPIGQRIGGATPFMNRPREVIGIVSDVRPLAQLGATEGGNQMYRPIAQRGPTLATVALRAASAPSTLAPQLRRVVAGLDADVAVTGISTVRQDASRSLASLQLAAWTLVGFAGLGVLLAAVGIYGVIAHTVAQRTNEIGIRMALGAQVRDVFALILGRGLKLTFMGVALGLGGAYGVSRLLHAITPEFSAANAGLTAMITLFLVTISALACWLPARRATKVDPMIALRTE
jgi:putative ABC transport system permease protein